LIIIISEENDNSTNKVIDWLLYYKVKYHRITQTKTLDLLEYNISNNNITVKIDGINFKDITGFWYRRGRLIVKNPPITLLDNYFNSQLEYHLNLEKEHISNNVYQYIRQLAKVKIGDFDSTKKLNKQEVLLKARKFGLMTPATLITSHKSYLLNFIRKYGKVITKAISDVESFHLKGKGFVYTYTSIVEQNEFIPEVFFPSLFQQYIEKKYELRIFYLKRRFYAMAIFSQSDKQTRVDFRNYNTQTPNRSVPYNLGIMLKIKLILLMRSLKFESGSIDIVVDLKGNHYFLEVNPVGQYDMINVDCNFNLHEKFAKALCH